MSKNIFNILPTNHDDSDEERPVAGQKTAARPGQQKTQGAQGAPHATKKEQRAQNQQLRENYGDQAGKEYHGRNHNGPQNKGDYAPGEKRPFDRRSGTGRPAFARNDFKKGGHGKGNAGTYENAGSRYVQKAKSGNEDGQEPTQDGDKPQNEGADAQSEQTGEQARPQPEVEEIISAEDYLAKSGLSFGFLKQQQTTETSKTAAPKLDDPTLKVMSTRQKDEPTHSKKAKNHDALMQTTSNILTQDAEKQQGQGQKGPGYERRESNRRGQFDGDSRKPRYNGGDRNQNQDFRQQKSFKPAQLNDNDFPTLN